MLKEGSLFGLQDRHIEGEIVKSRKKTKRKRKRNNEKGREEINKET